MTKIVIIESGSNLMLHPGLTFKLDKIPIQILIRMLSFRYFSEMRDMHNKSNFRTKLEVHKGDVAQQIS